MCITCNSGARVFLLILLWQLTLISFVKWDVIAVKHAHHELDRLWEDTLCHAVGFNRNLTAAVQCDTLITLLKSQRYYRIQVQRIPTVYFFLSINHFICSKRKHWYKIAFQIWQSFACCVSNMCERKGMLRNLRFKGHSATAPGFWKPQLEPASWLVWTFGLSRWLSSTISVKDVSRVEFQHMSK